MRRALYLELMCLPLIGALACDDLMTAKAKQADPPRKIIHHFEPIARSEGSLAVDTATGQMCKTWDWVCVEASTWNSYTKKWQDNSRFGVAC